MPPTSRSSAPETASAGGTAFISLPARLTVAEAGELRKVMSSVVDQNELTLDASHVESVGVAGLQVLLSLVKTRTPQLTTWHAPSTTLLAAARLAGIQEALGLPNTLSDDPVFPAPMDCSA